MKEGQGKASIALMIVFLLILAAFCAISVKHLSGKEGRFIHRDTIVHGDGARLYAYLRSAWMDGDLDTANELDHYFNYPGSKEPREITKTSTGYAWNHTAVGCALLWSPFFLFGHATAIALNGSVASMAVDGYSPPYTLAVGCGTHLYCFLGVWLLFSILCRYHRPFIALLAVLTVWLASFLPAYVFFYPSMSHSLSFFSVCLFLRLWLEVRDKGGAWRWSLLGLSVGLMTLVRTQNIIFALVPLAGAFSPRRGDSPAGVAVAGVSLMAAFAFLSFAPQLYTWKVTYGSWVTVPQGPGFLHWGRPALLQLLFSSRHGLFSWTPALLLGVIGFPAFIRRERALGLSLAIVFLAQFYINAVADDWWAGTGFGARRFANCLPILALGIAEVYAWLRSRRLAWLAAAVSGLLIVWNGLFLCQYALNWVSHMEAIDMKEMALNQGRVAVHIIRRVI